MDHINESLPKGTEERIHRRTRPKKLVHSKNPADISIHRDADNDPAQTSRGRRNFRGSEKRQQDKNKRDHPDKFTEAIDFINNNNGKEIVNIVESAYKISDYIALDKLLNKLIDEESNIGKVWLHEARNVVAIAAEERGQTVGPYLARNTDSDGINYCLARAKAKADYLKSFYPIVWVEMINNGKFNIVEVRAVGGFNKTNYENAINEGLVVFSDIL